MEAHQTGRNGAEPQLARRLGLFDAIMLVMGGIVGSGIFLNPAEVARHVSSPGLIVGAWLIGGAVAIAGAFVYAELAARRPEVGGQYAYLRDAWGPMPAFLYGWSLLLVIQSGGMAAVAITFARHFHDLVALPVPDGAVAAGVLALLTAINCLGVRAGSNVQSFLMVLKIAVIAALVLAGLLLAGPARAPAATSFVAAGGIGAALTPVMFAYGGWQTSSFVAGEMRDPRRDLARGVLIGVAGVVLLYTAVALTCVYVLGPTGLAETRTPATSIMRLALGDTGASLIALGIAVSALGFLSQGMLTTPRVYFAMAEDRLFFRTVAKVNAKTHAPVAAILLQGIVAVLIALSGTYGSILSYVVSVDFIWFALTGAALFVFRARDAKGTAWFEAPGHPFTTGLFVVACAVIVGATVYNDLANSAVGFIILLAGIPAFLYWKARRNRA
ncbi:MAG: amino acid permease [Alphaproteobacteria bacterium]|nr:MAG: amino acid permease [Alphaproteobacteria bacterium]